MKYAVIIERGETSYGAYVPDLPGCFAVGNSLDEVKRILKESIEFHLEGLQMEGISIPSVKSLCEYVEV